MDAATQKKNLTSWFVSSPKISGLLVFLLLFGIASFSLLKIGHISNSDCNSLIPFFIIGFLVATGFGYLISILLRKPAKLQELVHYQAMKLLDSEIKFKSMFDQAAIGIAHVDVNTGKIIDANGHYCNILGYSSQEMKKKSIKEVTHPDDIQKNLENLQKIKSGEITQFSMEKRYFNKSGATIWANLTVSPLWNKGEKPTAYIGVIEDITQRKAVKDELRKSEARFKSLFDDSPLALWEEDFSEVKKCLENLDFEGQSVESYFHSHPEMVTKCISLVKIIDVNNECLRLHYPKTKEELMQSLTGIADPSLLDVFIKQLAAIINKKNELMLESQLVIASGETRDISLRWNVMRGHEETLERVIISTEDITAHKEYERIVRQSQQKLESLVNSIDGILWECDAETFEMIFLSSKSVEILGYTQEQWASDSNFWEKHIHPEDNERCVEVLMAVAKDKKNQDFEYRMFAADGSIVWIRDFINVNFVNGKALTLRGIMIDITKSKQNEEDLNNSLQLVNEQKKRLMNFSYIVSHNLRSHTANIHSITNLIESADNDQERKELVGMLKTVSGSLNETMLHLNDLVNIQANVTLITEPLSLDHYIEATLQIHAAQIAKKQATIVNHATNVTINYNPAYLESILLNLISNALRYSHPDRKPVITIDWISENGQKVLQIADNGIGIDLKKHGDKLFGMYKTFNGNTDARGIGLFMTKSQIEAMGGKISVRSEIGIGTAITILFK